MEKKQRRIGWISLGWCLWGLQLFAFWGYLVNLKEAPIYKFTLRGIVIVIAEVVGFNMLNLIALIVGLTFWKKYKNNSGRHLAYASAGLFIINIVLVFFIQLLGNL